MVPVEVLPSPQLIVAVNALAGSTPLAWVNVATVKLVSRFGVVVIGPDTMMAASATVVVAEALLLVESGSDALVMTEAELVRLPSSVAWAVIVMVTLPGKGTVPRLNVTTLPDCVNVPWLLVAETKRRLAPSVSVRTVAVASLEPLLVTVTLKVMLSPSVAVAGPVSVTARSAGAPTIDPVTVAELLEELGSLLVLLMEAVLEKFEPGVRLAGARTTTSKVSVLPAAMSAAAVSVAVPADCDNVKESGPDICVIDTKFEPAGRGSVSTKFWAAEGPLLVGVIV